MLPDGRVFVAATNNAEIYDPHSGTFTPTGPYADPSFVYGTTVTLLTNGKVLVTVVTGCPISCSVGEAELFDPQRPHQPNRSILQGKHLWIRSLDSVASTG